MFKHILIATDGSDLARVAVQKSLELAKALGAKVTAVTVTQHETFVSVDEAELDPLLRRIGDARVVLIGESTHGTSEFYRTRARITGRLIAEKGFSFVAIEADWPDAARVDNYVRDRHIARAPWTAFARFPTWMWAQ
jgi:erythromycin esterase-like protein